MTDEFIPYDPADSLTTPEGVAFFITDAFETADPGYIAHAMGIAARSRGMTEIAAKTGLSREALYRSLTAEGNPTLRSVMLVMEALGLQLTVTPRPMASAATEAVIEAEAKKA